MYNVSKTCQISGLDSIYQNYFGYPSKGFFVEVGANDGEFVSNTSCLSDHGWKGIYVEPVTQFYNQCTLRHIKNDVTVINCAIGSQEGEIDLYVGGALTTTDPKQVERYSEIDFAKTMKFSKTTCKQIRLDTLLKNNNVKPNFDLLVVDVEGQESDVINSFNISYWKPKMLIVKLEDNHVAFKPFQDLVAKIKTTRQHIIDSGYVELYSDTINTIFVVKES